MKIILIAVFAIASCVGFIVMMYLLMAKRLQSAQSAVGALEGEVEKFRETKARLEGVYSEMVDVGSLRQIAEEIRSVQEALKAERGRIMITQAELETVESRLRELEELERELEASGIETKQELVILKKKHDELADKNKTLRDQIQMSTQQIDQVIAEIQFSAEVQAQIDNMKMQLVKSQEKIDLLLLQIEQGNDQYFNLKKRYDALDIEYAQLYEKFADSESSQG